MASTQLSLLQVWGPALGQLLRRYAVSSKLMGQFSANAWVCRLYYSKNGENRKCLSDARTAK